MKLRYSDYAILQLENILHFLVKEQGVSFEKAFDIRQKILDRIDLLLDNLEIGQREEYLHDEPRVYRVGQRRAVRGSSFWKQGECVQSWIGEGQTHRI